MMSFSVETQQAQKIKDKVMRVQEREAAQPRKRKVLFTTVVISMCVFPWLWHVFFLHLQQMESDDDEMSHEMRPRILEDEPENKRMPIKMGSKLVANEHVPSGQSHKK